MKIAVIGRAGSDYRKAVNKWLGKVPLDQANAVFNYGLQGEKLKKFVRTHRRLEALPVLNFKQNGNKYEHIVYAANAGVRVPSTWKKKDLPENTDPLIAKPYYSLGGKDIFRIKNTTEEADGRTHYFQEEVLNRRYEIRVICASWLRPNEWLFQKRVHEDGDDELAWNHHNGGKFVTVENPEEPIFQRIAKDTTKLLMKFGYQFGAVDYIVQNPGRRGKPLIHYFIEWNLAPGWTIDRSREWYEKTFKKLNTFTYDTIEALEEGMMIEEIMGVEEDDPELGGERGRWGEYIIHEDVEQDQVWGRVLNNVLDEPPVAVDLGQVLPVNRTMADIINDKNQGHNYLTYMCTICGHNYYLRHGDYRMYCQECGSIIEIGHGQY